MTKLCQRDRKERGGCHLTGLTLTGPNVPCPRRALLEKELESVGIRLNKSKPNIYFKVRPGGLPLSQLVSVTIKIAACCPSCRTDRGGFALFLSRFVASLQPKKGGGISFNSTVTLTQCSEKLVQLILHEYSILFLKRRPSSLESAARESRLSPWCSLG